MISGIALLAQLAIGAQAIPILTRADPTAGAEAHTELRVTAPLLFGTAHLAGGHVELHAMVNLEGWTMPGGQLATGDWGEGFEDRRHPHAIGHELMATLGASLPIPASVPVTWSLSLGRGFAPYGTDDPMSRTALIYPVNHHWSQVLERAVLIAAVRAGPVTLEGGIFNGDEPLNWQSWPNLDRFGDSWSLRGLVRPVQGLELQVSRAKVKSPEHRFGAGLDHELWSASASFEKALRAGDLAVHAEWAHADEEGAYFYSSVLAEAQLAARAGRPYLRVESTTRPEERIFEPFRSPRPHNENGNLGATRWVIVTAGFDRRVATFHAVRLDGIAEVAHAHVTTVTGIAFDPQSFYGRNDLWLFSVALRISAGSPIHRMGRYGVARDAGVRPSMGHMHHP